MTGQQSQRANAAEGQTSTTTRRSVTAVLVDDETRETLRYAVGLFAVVGCGVGVTGAFGARLLAGGSRGFGVLAFAVAAFAGPILAAAAGLLVRQRARDAREGRVTAFAAGSLGYLAATLASVLCLTLLLPGSSGRAAAMAGGGRAGVLDPGTVLVPLGVMAVPAGLVAAAALSLRDAAD